MERIWKILRHPVIAAVVAGVILAALGLLWPPAATFAARTVRSSAGAILKWLAAPAPRISIISGFCIGALFVAGLWNVIGRRSGRAASTAQRGSKELNLEQRKMLLWLGMMYPKPQSIESLVET